MVAFFAWIASLSDRLNAIRNTSLYLTSYSLPTLHAHATYASAYTNVTMSEGQVQYSFKQPDAKIDPCVIHVFMLMYRVFKAMVSVFRRPFEDDVERFGLSL